MATVEINPRLAAALTYAALGWPVVPLHTPAEGVCDCPKKSHCESPGKHPRTMHGLDDATTDEAKIRRWWAIWPYANIAIDLARAGLLDIAPDSVDWYAEFIARGLPATVTFHSAGGEGHMHFLYLRPEACPVYRLTQSGEYDILTAGYAVVPPSVGVSGREYAFTDAFVGAPTVVAPAWAAEQLARKGTKRYEKAKKDHGSNGTSFSQDVPPVVLTGDALERWYGRLYESKASGGPDRSRSLWRIAVDLLEAGLAPTFVEIVLAERDMVLGWEKFVGRSDAHDRYHIITERAVSGQGSKRVRLNHEPPKRAAALVLDAFQTAIDLAIAEDEDVLWFAHGLLAAGLITELDGKAKQSGKTTLLLCLCRAVLTGQDFLGKPTTYSPVTYLTEQSGPSFKRNLDRAGLLDRPDFHLLLWNKAVEVKWPDIVGQTREYMRQVGARILIVDTLSQFSGIRGEAENSSGAALETMEPVQAATSDGLAILVSRHDRKSGGEVGDSGRGSSAYAGAVDVVLHLQRVPAGQRQDRARQRVLDGISRFDETPDQSVIELQPEAPYAYTLVGDVQDVRNASLRVELLGILPTVRDDAPDLVELRKDLQVREFDLRQVLRELVAEGLVEKFDRPARFRQIPQKQANDD